MSRVPALSGMLTVKLGFSASWRYASRSLISIRSKNLWPPTIRFGILSFCRADSSTRDRAL